VVIGFHLLSGSIKSEAEVREMLPFKIAILGTIPPIQSNADLKRGRLITAQTLVVSLITCTALVIFLLKVRPIL
jgi:succinoglycan biosynthesis transport protein ExoP